MIKGTINGVMAGILIALGAVLFTVPFLSKLTKEAKPNGQ